MKTDMQLHQKLITEFEDFLTDLQKERKARPDIGDFHGEALPNWAIYEIEEMFKKVNLTRAKLNLEPCSVQTLLVADSRAAGHSDYSHKFALYCAEIVQDNFS
jgi:hypothetical protein